MYARVRALIVSRNGAAFLDRTLAALAAQTRRPDSVTAVDGGSSDATAAMLAAAEPAQFVSANGRASFGSLVARGLDQAAPAESQNEWLWLLAHDNAPAPDALAALLGAVEVAPSVAVAGPKLMEWDRPDYISSYGKTITALGATIELVDGELDQAQHDRRSDVLAVSGCGMLVRRSVWEELGGFDPALPSVDAALDFCIRVRLAGHRIVGVPAARVASAGGPETFGKRAVSTRVLSRIRRTAQLHRRLTYAPGFAVVFHWLSLLPLAVGRSVTHLLAKRPAEITGEFSAAVSAALSSGVIPARRNLARTKKLGWAAIDPFRMGWSDVRETRANRRETQTTAIFGTTQKQRLSFFGAGGAWIVLFVAAVGVVAMVPFLGAASLSGGGLAPLSAHLGDLWSNTGYGWREIGAGFVGASDPFAFVLAVLGSLTFWAPSQAIVLIYVAALPLAALAGWWCAARFTVRAWPPAVAAIVWAFSPPLLASLNGGHIGAVIAHLLLPWLVIAMLSAVRSWSAAAAASLLMAGIIASAPVLAPAIVIAWFAWVLAQPRSISRLAAIPLPTAALFAPLVVSQVLRGTPVALFAEPGVPYPSVVPSGWQLGVLSPADGFNGWEALLSGLSLPALAAPVVVAALLAPLAVLAVLGLFLPGSRRSIPAMIIAFLGFATAVASTRLEVSFDGSTPVAIWASAGLSLFWLGLIGSAVVALDALGKAAPIPSLVAVAAVLALCGPLLAAPIAGTTAVSANTVRMLPAFVTAEAANNRVLGTIELTAQNDGGLAATLHRGAGTTLDARSTLAATSTSTTQAQQRIAVLAGNLASRSGFDVKSELSELGIGFVLSSEVRGETARGTRARIGESLDSNPAFTAIGDTANGYLWSFEGGADGNAQGAASSAIPRPDPLATPLGAGILAGQLLIIVMTLLLAIPTPGRVRARSVVTESAEPASTFEEEDDA
ncbi:MAG: glycosyltransferase family 2 protein [Microbacteriaceae bacterium]